VVLNASALPDPREVSYDLLLSYVTASCVKQLLLSDTPTDTFSRTLIFMVRTVVPHSLLSELNNASGSRVRLHGGLFRGWKPAHTWLELGMESIPEPESKVSQESETIGALRAGS
jgi:hypothetical protein